MDTLLETAVNSGTMVSTMATIHSLGSSVSTVEVDLRSVRTNSDGMIYTRVSLKGLKGGKGFRNLGYEIDDDTFLQEAGIDNIQSEAIPGSVPITGTRVSQ